MPKQSHQNQAHQDELENQRIAKGAVKAQWNSNPFSLTNMILTIMLLYGAWGSKYIFQSVTDSLSVLQKNQSETHDALMVHGFLLTNLVGDIQILRVNCMTQDKVDDRIRLIAPQHSSIMEHGAQDLVNHK